MDQMLLLIKTLPHDMIEEIKSKIGISLHNGFWSAWIYNNVTKTLIVELGKLHIIGPYEEQITIIYLLIDLNLVDTLVLRTCYKSCNRSQYGLRIEKMEQLDLTDFSYFVDSIDITKIKNVIIDKEYIDYETDYLNGPCEIATRSQFINQSLLIPSLSYKDALLQHLDYAQVS
jgi:hypothetical protein